MATDLAQDSNSGDLLFAPNLDLERRVGQSTIDQRIRIRLRIHQGEWDIDPTGGQLGSTLSETVRLPIDRALQEIPLVVKEALLPMEDILVQQVIATPNEDDPRAIDMTILYQVHDDGSSEAETQTTTLTLVG